MTAVLDALFTDRQTLRASIDAAGRQIPPVWPLASSVAVNPFLGQTGEDLATLAVRLGRVGGIPVAMPRAWFRDMIARGDILPDDLAAAIDASPHADKPPTVEVLRARLNEPSTSPAAIASIADLAAEVTGRDWPGIIADRISLWAGGHFDEGQALWSAPRGRGAWMAWRAFATHDLTPEIQGLTGFAARAADAPDDPVEAIAAAVARLRLSEAAVGSFFHQTLASLGGWAQVARHALWRAELAGGTDTTLVDLLAIRLMFDAALYEEHGAAFADAFERAKAAHAAPIAPTAATVLDAILQDASERAGQRDLAARLAAPVHEGGEARPALQAAFCIDVRSEVFRRALEAVSPAIRTLGFAGFFGVFARHRRFASDVEELRLPVLLNPTVRSCTGLDTPAEADRDRDARFSARATRAWGRFKLAAISSFAFVEAMGPVYAGKLVRDGLGLTAGARPNDPKPRFEPALDLPTRIGAAETILRAMSLTEGFARLVVLAGHGASVVNNPFASGLHCGACGGYSGEVNARLLAVLLNDRAVREGLVSRGITVPDDTLFVGALHDTTTDAITLYDLDEPSPQHRSDLRQARDWFAAAGRVTRGERALRLPRAANEAAVARRSRDWSEVRPEWALAGCKAFIAAPRSRTAGRRLDGEAFLHDYDWKADGERGYPVLELIMTAPVVVASWISLQYYGSVVAPDQFGSGNKLLHNVVGGIGVFEGNGGVLRAGLPFQSVHDGDGFAHKPLRLTVCIEAPVEAMTAILARHEGVRALFDNGWLHLMAIGPDGGLTRRYLGDLKWSAVAGGAVVGPALKAVA